MANNRYYLFCQCGKVKYLGKSLGRGITPEQSPAETEDQGYARFLDGVYDWMWKHLIECKGNERYKGEIFKVITV